MPTAEEEIPYSLPSTREGKIAVLAEIVDIKRVRFRNVSNEDTLKALTGLILYRHLSRREERKVNRHWQSLPPDVQRSLRKRRAAILINPSWGMWSLSNEELLERNDLNQRISFWAKALGIGDLSVKSLGSLLGKIKAANLGSVASLILIGTFVMMNSLEGQEINAEMVRRLRDQGALQ